MLRWAITNTLETNEEIQYQQKNKIYQELSITFTTENEITAKKSMDVFNSRMGVSQESVNWTMEQ